MTYWYISKRLSHAENVSVWGYCGLSMIYNIGMFDMCKIMLKCSGVRKCMMYDHLKGLSHTGFPPMQW